MVAGQNVTFTIPNHVFADEERTFTMTTSSDFFTPPGDYTNTINITSSSNATPIITPTGDQSAGTATTTRVGAGGIFVQKSAVQEVREVNSTIAFNINYANTGAIDRQTGHIIDVFPFNGDNAGVVERDPFSTFVGDVSFVSAIGTNGETFEYTTATASTINHEPCHPDNWPAGIGFGDGNATLDTVCQAGLLNATGDPDLTVDGTGIMTWLAGPVPTDNTPTAIRITTQPMAAGSGTRTVALALQTVNNQEGNSYCNNYASQFAQKLDEISNDVCIPVVAGTIGNFVWEDNDNDGVQDAGELGIANIDVKLLDAANNPYMIDDPLNPGTLIPYVVTTSDGTATYVDQETGATVTLALGEYIFQNLPSGTYNVMVDTATLPTGATQTYDSDDGVGATDSMSTVTLNGPTTDTALTDVEDNVLQDFGYILGVCLLYTSDAADD